MFFIILAKSEKWFFPVASFLSVAFVTLTILWGESTALIDRISLFLASEGLPVDIIDIDEENFTAHKFVKTPNIYLLSFDALIPERIVDKFLEIENKEVPAYITTLKQLNANIIPNVFSNSKESVSSFAALLALDLEWIKKIKDRRAIVMGVQSSPGYKILQENNYEIQFTYETNYFETDYFLAVGNNRKLKFSLEEKEKSKLIYKPNYFSVDGKIIYFYGKSIGFCTHVVPQVFFGYCSLRKDRNTRKDIYDYSLQRALNLEKPTFIISYYDLPRQAWHAGSMTFYKDQDLLKYSQDFLENSKIVAEVIKKNVALIRENDPNGIIIIFGDHGTRVIDSGKASMIISDNWPYEPKSNLKELPADSPVSRVDIIQDRQAVILAVLDPHGCRLRGEKLTTLDDMMLNLMECLSGGKSVLKNRVDNQNKYIDYLYDTIE